MLLRRTLIVIVFALALVMGAGCGDDDPSARGTTTTTEARSTSTSSSTTSTTTTSTSTTTTTTTTTTAPPTTPPPTTSPPTTEPPSDRILSTGDSGPQVAAVQERLAELRYWVGPIDGVYGTLTEQAVYAFQKVNDLLVDGVVGPEVRAALDDPAPYEPETSTGDIMEVDKTDQVLAHVVDGQVDLVWNTATGTGNPYTFEGEQRIADTPSGRHQISWQVDGVREAALGDLYRPKYFHRDGIAIHGYGNVPPTPASHGCVRVTRAAMDHIWATGMAPEGSTVVVFGTTPDTDEVGSGPETG